MTIDNLAAWIAERQRYVTSLDMNVAQLRAEALERAVGRTRIEYSSYPLNGKITALNAFDPVPWERLRPDYQRGTILQSPGGERTRLCTYEIDSQGVVLMQSTGERTELGYGLSMTDHTIRLRPVGEEQLYAYILQAGESAHLLEYFCYTCGEAGRPAMFVRRMMPKTVQSYPEVYAFHWEGERLAEMDEYIFAEEPEYREPQYRDATVREMENDWVAINGERMFVQRYHVRFHS